MTRYRLGLLGGTFDPPHIGHLIVAQDVFEALELDRLVFLPSNQPPHKHAVPVTAARTRLEMTRAAVSGDARFEVSDVELRRGGVSFTVDTLRQYRELEPGAQLHFVVGSDQAACLESWREPEVVAQLATLVVMERSGRSPEQVRPQLDLPFRLVPVTRVEVSSTQIRDRRRAGKPIDYLVPDEVIRIIERERLYVESDPNPADI